MSLFFRQISPRKDSIPQVPREPYHETPLLHPQSLYGRRSLGRTYADVITKFSRLDELPIFLKYGHREHTILLSRERVNKGTKRMNSLRLSPHLIFSILREFTGKTTAYKSCVTCSAKLVPRPFRAQQKIFLVCIKFDKGGNSLSKHFERTAYIRSNL